MSREMDVVGKELVLVVVGYIYFEIWHPKTETQGTK